jgi:hypothetical protein
MVPYGPADEVVEELVLVLVLVEVEVEVVEVVVEVVEVVGHGLGSQTVPVPCQRPPSSIQALKT